ncbi:pggt1b [Trichonephila clavipes]|nr:pggt1b [Trichonephila clavipes]
MFELKRALSSAHNTSPGPDGVSYELLRHLNEDSLVRLGDTLSASFCKLKEFLRKHSECHPFYLSYFTHLKCFIALYTGFFYVDDLQISCEGSDMRMIERQLQTAVNILKCKSTVAPVVFKRVFAYHRSQYSRYSVIYTDGSKRADYVGCGVVIEDVMHGYRLDTSCSIFTSEAVAIYRALHQ